MTSFEFITQMTRSSLVFLQERAVSSPQGGPIKLQCPSCAVESAIARALPVDTLMVCGECGEESEYRQMREAWCLDRRAYLARACPEIDFPLQREFA